MTAWPRENYFKKTALFFERIKKGFYICTRIQANSLMRHSRRNGRVVECGSLENC